MKSIFVTGATGFIGRQTLAFLKKKMTVHASYLSNQPVTEHQDVYWHKLDLHDKQQVTQLLSKIKPNYLLHLAWYAKPADYKVSPINIQWIESSLHLLNTFINEDGEKAVFAGSEFEYDFNFGRCREYLTPCLPDTLYGRAKYSLNLLSDCIAKSKSLPFVWARIFPLFGPHEYPQRLISSAIYALLQRKHFKVMSGNTVRDYIYVIDLAHALVSLVESDIVGTINIASGQPLAVREIINLIAHKLSASELVEYEDHFDLANNLTIIPDITRLSKELNWKPKYTLNAAIDETISWWQRYTKQ